MSSTQHQPASGVDGARSRIGLRRVWPVLALLLVIALGSEMIGQVPVHIGNGSIIFFPMVWGLLAAGAVSLQKIRPMPVVLQKASTSVVNAAVLLLVARLAYNVGPNLDKVMRAGPALLLQEVGHLLGTVGLALPLAVLLRMGRATVGATFSLDREPSFGIVSERYGADSDEYRGVLAMYVFGTLFGALYITFLASLLSSAGIFDPLALAMGAGVGSGSMMAAATGSIIATHPGDASQITAVAAVSNLLTTILGVYVGMYVALPLAQRFYRMLTRRDSADESSNTDNRRLRERFAEAASAVTVPLTISLPILTVVSVGTAAISGESFNWDVVVAYATMLALVIVGLALGELTRVISPIIWITTLGALVSSPWSPIGTFLGDAANSVSILSIGTVMLTAAGLGIGKDAALLRNVGWKIIPVGLLAITASFGLSTVVAEFVLGFWS